MGPMERPTSARPLLILAMDQRDSFAKLFGTEEQEATPDQVEQMRAAKTLVYRGVAAVADQVGDVQIGVLTDEEYGPEVLQRAKADGRVLAYPVEKSGQKLFDLEYGDDTAAHVERWDPDYVKVLVRMNPDDDQAGTRGQLDRLKALSDQLRASDRPFLFELLVPASDAQLASVGGDSTAYDRDLRPGLGAQVIHAVQDAGVEPTLWKIEGLETADAAREIVAAAKRDGRDADCIVLGRDAPQETLDHWLQVAAPVDGFVGFAIGRSIWKEPLQRYLDDGDEAAFLEVVGQNYLHYVRTYLAAR
ncbi:Myo-inositol catabolism protein IolC [Microlunatus flavus]|uniref:Myo-inositol catabolism protein IolC n=2 Tax=Microlunatus flavus TaxID=1036181 RepID=A0A1H9M0M6_9ACTN|nr:Myo-inositol catabolism protein IolC [Microlunatus flavus]